MKRWALILVVGISLATVGCGTAYASGYYYASTPPPPVRAEFFGPSPGPGFVWVQGFWGLQGGRYVWMPGRWDRPPRGYSRWETGRWERRGNRYRWRDGRWR